MPRCRRRFAAATESGWSFAGVLFSPDFSVVADVGELGADFDVVGLHVHAAAYHDRHAQFASCILDFNIFSLEPEDRIAGTDFELRNVGEVQSKIR